MEEWRRRISAVIVMKASPKDSLMREQGHLPVEGDGGSIMNLEVLTQMHRILIDTVARISRQFRIYEFDTSAEKYNNKQTVTCEAVASTVLDVIEIELNEKILSLKKERLFEGRSVGTYLNSAQATEILDLFHEAGEFERREVVEADTSRVQALPIVIVRNKSGKILRLVRRERDDSNALHGKTVIWAGGHVRQEDGADGRSAILWGAVRELNEELRLMVEPDSLELKGAVYDPSTERSAQHMAMVYEWRAESDSIEIALCRSEFFERQGNSLRGDFVSAGEIIEEVKRGGIDDWSRAIVGAPSSF